jgi:hypothetical protein
MAVLPGTCVAQVTEYRVFVFDKDNHIASFRSFVCGSDADGVVWAKQLADGHDVELWSGDRFVIRLDHNQK